MKEILKKKFNPRIKARIRKNKQIINKNIDNFFDWIKGAELVELKNCNTEEDPVRPELDNVFRRSYGRKIYETRTTCTKSHRNIYESNGGAYFRYLKLMPDETLYILSLLDIHLLLTKLVM